SFIIMKISCPLKEQLIFHYNPHFNWAPQLVHVLHPPISATCPSRHTGQRSPASDPTATFVFSSSCIVSISTTFRSFSSSKSSDNASSKLNCSSISVSSAFSVSTCVSLLPST